MTYKQQQHLKSLLTDAIVELCRRESFYVEELRIEGTICIVSDRSSVVIAQITEQVGEKFSDAEPDNDEITFEDDSTVPFKNKESNGQSNAEEETCSNVSPEDEEDEDYKDDLGEGSSGAQRDSEMPCLESNHLDDAAVNIGLDVAEQLANIMSIYNQIPKTETDDSPARQLSPLGRQSSVAQSEGFPSADALVGFDENISLERSANGKFQCPYCVKSYGFKHTLKEHLNKHLGKRPHVCKHCGDSFTHLASLCAHVKRRHDDLMPQDFQCALCQEKLMNYQSLKQHYTWRHKDVKFPEDKLDQDAPNLDRSSSVNEGDAPELDSNSKPKRRRRSRRRIVVKPETDDLVVGDKFGDGQKRIKVEFSDEVNNTLPLDSSALLEAFERKDYESIQEGFAASFLDNLGLDGGSDMKFRDDGMSSAAGLGFQKMDGASDTFQYAQMIARYFDEIHIETEQGLYRYRCKVCNNMFKIRNSLYEHLNSHFGKKPHQCSFCGDSFAHHSSLHNHVRNKHSFQTSAEKQASFKHFCLGCDRKFRYRSELERHLKCNPDHAMGGLPVQ